LHENYLGSCNLLGGLSRGDYSLEVSLACAVTCVENLSDSDLLSSPTSQHRYNTYSDDTSSSIKFDEISLQAAARGVVIGLPTPVKRAPKDNKMFYPTSLRLWRQAEEVHGLVDLFARRDDMTGAAGVAKSQLLMDRMPYLKIVLKGRRSRAVYAAAALRELEVVTGFRGVGARSEDVPVPGEDGELETMDELERAEDGWGQTGRDRRRTKASSTTLRLVGGSGDDLGTVGGVGKLVLSDDDIEDDW
jgi:cell cycle checkpoint protein